MKQNSLRQIALLLMVVIGSLWCWNASAQLPRLSNDGKEYWYYLKFTKNGHYMLGNGWEEELLYATLKSTQSDGEFLWKLEGTDYDNFYLKNKNGRYVYVKHRNFARNSDPLYSGNADKQSFKLHTYENGRFYRIESNSHPGKALDDWDV